MSTRLPSCLRLLLWLVALSSCIAGEVGGTEVALEDQMASEPLEVAAAQSGLRIALYSGPGTGSTPTSSHDQLKAAMMRGLDYKKVHYTIKNIDAQEVRRLSVKNFDLVVFPGADSLAMLKVLGREAYASIKAFVKAGGNYFGVCAGAYLALNQLEMLGGKPAFMKKQSIQDFKMEFTIRGRRDLGLDASYSGVYGVHYGGGPLLSVDPEDAIVMARYDSPGIRNFPAIMATIYGKGRVLISSPHPEMRPRDLDSHVWYTFMRWVTRLETRALNAPLPVSSGNGVEQKPTCKKWKEVCWTQHNQICKTVGGEDVCQKETERKCKITKGIDVCWDEEEQICETVKKCVDHEVCQDHEVCHGQVCETVKKCEIRELCQDEEVCHSQVVKACKRVVGEQTCWFEDRQICRAVGGEEHCFDKPEEHCQHVCQAERAHDSGNANVNDGSSPQQSIMPLFESV